MKSTLATISSAVTLLSAVTNAMPAGLLTRDATSAFVLVKTGDGDASAGIEVPINSILSTAGNIQVNKGVNAEVAQPGFQCQAFSDNAGTLKLGGVFTDLITASFTNSSSGGVDSSADQAVPIGAFCCITDGETFDVCGGQSSVKTQVRVQLSASDDSAAQSEVPTDNSVFAVAAPLFSLVNAGNIVDLEGANTTTCQAFSDKKGKKAVGKPFGTDTVLFNGGKDVKVLSLRCKSA